MNSAALSDKALKQAARSVRESMLTTMPAPSECEHEFSAEFELKLDGLCAKEKQRQTRRKTARRIAAILLAVLITVGGWLAVDTKAYAAVTTWILEVSEKVFYREKEIVPTKYRLGVSGKDNFLFSVYASGYGFVNIQCDVESSELIPSEYTLEIGGVTYNESSQSMYFDAETGELKRIYATFYGLTPEDLSSEVYINVTSVMEKFTADEYMPD